MSIITLKNPISRGETEIKEIELTEPNAGALRGVRLTDLLNGDVDSVVKVLPRISKPSIQLHEIHKLSAVDLGQITGEIMDFFMPSAVSTDQEEPQE